MHCGYCINLYGDISRTSLIRGRCYLDTTEWIKAINRFDVPEDLPVTLQGGEPSLNKGFYDVIAGSKEEIKFEIITNLSFNIDEFKYKVPVNRLAMNLNRPSIRVSYHPGQNEIDELIYKASILQKSGFRIAIYGVSHPDKKISASLCVARSKCISAEIDFFWREFTGIWNGRLYGRYGYNIDSMFMLGDEYKSCMCRTNEFLIDPFGLVYRCYSDMYNGRLPIGHILDENFNEESIGIFRSCDYYGSCNPCNIKINEYRPKTKGRPSVEIKFEKEGGSDEPCQSLF